MPTLSTYAPSPTPTSAKADGADFEPDDEWKRQLKKRIEEGLKSMVQDAKDSQTAELRKAVVTPEVRLRLEDEYKQAMNTIKSLANEQYQLELNRERNQRRWTAGAPMHPDWTRILAEEQQSIMNNIKQSGSQDDRGASESPTDQRRPSLPTTRPVSEAAPPEPPEPHLLPQPIVQHAAHERRDDRDRHVPPPVSTPAPYSTNGRRSSDARSKASRDREDHPPNNARNGLTHVRPSLPDDWDSRESLNDPEDIIPRGPPPRSRQNTDPSALPDPSTWTSSLGRSSGSIRSASGSHLGRSPPKAAPEVWKPAAVPPEDPTPTPLKSAKLARRNSSTSMRSTGSGNSIRPSITEAIPEGADDVGEEDGNSGERERFEQERVKKHSGKTREKEKRRRDSRPSPVDPSIYADDQLPPRSGGNSSATMQFATASAPLKPLSAKSSFANGDERYHTSERSAKPPPFSDPRDHHPPWEPSYVHREPSYSRDRPVPTRSPYGPDDRDYGAPLYSAPGRPPPPKTPFSREYTPAPHAPISHKSSFTYDDRRRDRDWDGDREHWDDDRDYSRDRDYDYRDRERDRDRDREWDRDYYPESRHPPHHGYPARPAGYPTPPSSAARHPSHEYTMNEVYDDPPNRYGYRAHGPPPAPPPPPDEWEYQRSESARPIPSRQPSYSRRDDPERRIGLEIDPYSRPYTHHPPASVPIPHRHGPTEDQTVPAWREWAAEGGNGRRPSESRYEQYARSPPPSDHFPRRRLSGYAGGSPRDDIPVSGTRSKKQKPHSDEDEEDEDLEEHGREDADEEEALNGEGSDDQSSEASSEDDAEVEAQAQKMEEERREADKRIKEKAAEIQRLVEEEKRLEEEAKRKEEEVRRKEEELKRKEEEAKRVEEEARRREEEEEASRREEEAAKKAEEARKKEEEVKRKEKEQRQREQEVRRKAAEAKRLEEEAGRKAEEAKKKEAEINRKEEQTKKKEKKLQKDAEETRRLQAEANRIAEETRRKQESLHRLEEETKKKEQEIQERERALQLREEELKRREQEAWKKEEDARRLEAEARRKEQETRKKEEEVRRKEADAKRKAEEIARKEAEAKQRAEEIAREEAAAEEARKQAEEARKQAEEKARREQETKRREEAKQREEEAKRREEETKRRKEEEEARRREEDARQREDADRYYDENLFDLDPRILEEQSRLLQQAQFRKREEDIKRSRAEGRKRNDSIGNESTWLPGTSPVTSRSPPQFGASSASSASDRLSGSSTWTSSAWSTSTKPSTVPTPSPSRTSAAGIPPPTKPRTGSVSSGTYPSGSSPHSAPPISESEWSRRHAEFTNNQQEKFRREQERLEAERQMRSAGKPLSREEVQRVFEHHDRQWGKLPTSPELTWPDFPWPMLKAPANPDDIVLPLINAYFQSPYWPERDKTKPLKDRIKDHLRRWHPDRFDSKTLPRVVESESEKVKEGAGIVVRFLNDLLRKENENNSSSNLFGD